MDFSVIGPIMGVVGVLYLLPSFTAVLRQRPNMRTIFGVNLLLGWTIVGWIVAMMMALKGRQRERGHTSIWSTSGRKPCPSCGHSLAKNARRCRQCGYTITAKSNA